MSWNREFCDLRIVRHSSWSTTSLQRHTLAFGEKFHSPCARGKHSSGRRPPPVPFALSNWSRVRTPKRRSLKVTSQKFYPRLTFSSAFLYNGSFHQFENLRWSSMPFHALISIFLPFFNTSFFISHACKVMSLALHAAQFGLFCSRLLDRKILLKSGKELWVT